MSIDEIVHSIDASIAEIDAKNAHLLAEREKLRRAHEALRPSVPDVHFKPPFVPETLPPGISFPICVPIGGAAGTWWPSSLLTETVITFTHSGITPQPSPAGRSSAP